MIVCHIIRFVRVRKVAIYVHSTRTHSDGQWNLPDSIVYANQRNFVTHQDPVLSLLPGCAHTAPVPFHPTGNEGDENEFQMS